MEGHTAMESRDRRRRHRSGMPSRSERSSAKHVIQGPRSLMENSMKRFVLGAALVLMAVVPVLAHHSPAAFDRTKEVKLTGVITGFKWTNPHSWIEMEVTNDKGVVEKWGVEMTSPTYLVRAGWKSTSVKPGDKVTITVNPVRTG